MNIFEDKLINNIYEQIKDKNYSVVIPDGEDPRVINAITYLKDIKIVLLGDSEKINKLLKEKEGQINIDVEVITPSVREDLLEILLEKTKNSKKPLTKEEAMEKMIYPPYYACLLLEKGEVDACVGGSIYPSSDILRPTLQIIKGEKPNKLISTYMVLQKPTETLVFSDCALNLAPDANQLVDITYDTIQSAKRIGIDPKVGMLCYSTKGSGKGEVVEKMQQAYANFINEYPEYENSVIGEIQFDAAYSAEVGKIKIKDSDLPGEINTFVFPDLNSGNIGYKIAQYLGGFEALGPLLQGVRKPVNDLSRGVKDVEIAKIIYLTLANLI